MQPTVHPNQTHPKRMHHDHMYPDAMQFERKDNPMRESLAPGVWGVVATPFQGSTLDLDTDSLARLVDHYEAIGATGLTVLGVFGEAAALTAAERGLVLEVVVEETQPAPRGGRDLALHRHRRRRDPRGPGGSR